MKTGIKDINNKDIKIGDTVKTQQHSGGILPPAPPTIGIVEIKKFNSEKVVIRYRKPHLSFDSFIALEGQINEIIETFQK